MLKILYSLQEEQAEDVSDFSIIGTWLIIGCVIVICFLLVRVVNLYNRYKGISVLIKDLSLYKRISIYYMQKEYQYIFAENMFFRKASEKGNKEQRKIQEKMLGLQQEIINLNDKEIKLIRDNDELSLICQNQEQQIKELEQNLVQASEMIKLYKLKLSTWNYKSQKDDEKSWKEVCNEIANGIDLTHILYQKQDNTSEEKSNYQLDDDLETTWEGLLGHKLTDEERITLKLK